MLGGHGMQMPVDHTDGEFLHAYIAEWNEDVPVQLMPEGGSDRYRRRCTPGHARRWLARRSAAALVRPCFLRVTPS